MGASVEPALVMCDVLIWLAIKWLAIWRAQLVQVGQTV